jgi:hypothetical protein
VFTARTGKRVGFTPLMYAYEQAEQDGLLELDGEDVVWHWPETADD